MTAHACKTFDPACYRCDLSRDETPGGGGVGDSWQTNQVPPSPGRQHWGTCSTGCALSCPCWCHSRLRQKETDHA